MFGRKTISLADGVIRAESKLYASLKLRICMELSTRRA
jgi:hypothetical protein